MSQRAAKSLQLARQQIQPAPRRSRIPLLYAAAMLCALHWPAHAETANSSAKSGRIFKSDRFTATGSIEGAQANVREVTITLNKSRTLELELPFSSAVVGAPDIADVLPMSDTVIYIQGKKVGTTNISVFDKDKQLMTVIDVNVIVDTQHVSKNIQSSIESRGIRVSGANDQIILSGTARDAVEAERAFSIAKAMAPGSTVINAMRIAQPQQVMLKVRYLEANRNAAREIGINWFGSNDRGTRGGSMGLGLPVGPAPTLDPRQVQDLSVLRGLTTFASGTTAEPFSTVIASVLDRGFNLDVMITALEQRGLVRLLAEPNLVALSGDEANFHAGGKIPVPVATPTGTGSVSITIQYQPFGVELFFQPTVLQDGIINLRLTPSVSQLDYANSVILEGFRIPALTTRQTKTTIELRSGQSFAISGLLQNEGLRDISQVPWLGTVPVLGALFRSSSYQKRETDLVVIVTPNLVAPAAPGQQLSTPLDQRIPSNDRDFFLNGRLDMRKRYLDYVGTGGEVQGPYGHIIVEEVAPPSGGSWKDGTWKH
jgi:pilus assembly protein CpaC